MKEQNIEEKKDQEKWSEYHNITKLKPPRPLLVKALEYVSIKNKAIDIGGGALNDTRHLLEKGFDVTVIDKSDSMEEEVKSIKNKKLHSFVVGFEDFDFPKNEYDIASAMYALPFIEPKNFDNVFIKIINSINTGGVFCGHFFGIRDEWSENPKMTFHIKEKIEDLLKDLELIYFKEEEKDGVTAKGINKHWHVFHIIAKKK